MSSVDGVIGRLQNGNGTVLVSGRGSTWANARELRVGDVEGQGTLMVEGQVPSRTSTVSWAA